MIKHKATREGDELSCPCGMRWGVNEPDPHTPEDKPTVTAEEISLAVLESIRKALK